MEEKYSYYIQMREILKQIQKSEDSHKANELSDRYIKLDIELRKLYDCDDNNNPHYDLDKIHDSIEDKLESYESDLRTIRNSIESGSTEYSEVDFDNFEKMADLYTVRFNAIHSLIVYRNNIDKKYYE